MAATKKLFLLDAYALVYRAHILLSPKHHALIQKASIHLFPSDLPIRCWKYLTKQKPTHIGVAFDTSAKTFRDEIFKEYKANRQETPEDIRYGVPKVKEIIRWV
jgi:DNA polymerase-1